MTSSATHNGQIPTDPATIVIALCALYLLLNVLTSDQRETLGLALAFLPVITPYLPEGGR